jgi:hypothetical protein
MPVSGDDVLAGMCTYIYVDVSIVRALFFFFKRCAFDPSRVHAVAHMHTRACNTSYCVCAMPVPVSTAALRTHAYCIRFAKSLVHAHTLPTAAKLTGCIMVFARRKN